MNLIKLSERVKEGLLSNPNDPTNMDYDALEKVMSPHQLLKEIISLESKIHFRREISELMEKFTTTREMLRRNRLALNRACETLNLLEGLPKKSLRNRRKFIRQALTKIKCRQQYSDYQLCRMMEKDIEGFGG